MPTRENDRLFISHDAREADTEVFWRAASSGIGWPDDNRAHGSVLIQHKDGVAWAKTIVSDPAAPDEWFPVTIKLGPEGAKFFYTEDYIDPDPSCEVKLTFPPAP